MPDDYSKKQKTNAQQKMNTQIPTKKKRIVEELRKESDKRLGKYGQNPPKEEGGKGYKKVWSK